LNACIQCLTPLPDGVRVCPKCRALQPATLHPAVIAPGVTLERGYGRIVVDTRAGAGGMGVVWRAWLFYAPNGPRAKDPAEPVALKVLRPMAQGRAEVRAFFLNEAATLQRLSHPNIVRFYEVFEHGATLVMALEYVDGDTLEDVISRHLARSRLAGTGALPGMPFRRAWYYFQQLLGALAATHALGIVHRDVKPSNLFLETSKDGAVVVRVCDFGLAKVTDPTTSLTGSGTFLGTPHYVSPEQATNAKRVDARSDVWSLAMSLYHALAGVSAFAGVKSFMQLVLELTGPAGVPSVQDKAPWIDPHLARVVHGALVTDPAQRCPSVDELALALEMAVGFDVARARVRPEQVRSLARERRSVRAARAELPASWDDLLRFG
jgi:serine/threonine-protein kinase